MWKTDHDLEKRGQALKGVKWGVSWSERFCLG